MPGALQLRSPRSSLRRQGAPRRGAPRRGMPLLCGVGFALSLAILHSKRACAFLRVGKSPQGFANRRWRRAAGYGTAAMPSGVPARDFQFHASQRRRSTMRRRGRFLFTVAALRCRTTDDCVRIRVMEKTKLASILELSVAERLQLVQDIWDSIVADASNLPLPEAHRRELDRRLAAYRVDPTAGDSWEVVQARIRRSLES